MNLLKFLLAILGLDGELGLDPNSAVFSHIMAEGPIVDSNGQHG